MRSPLLKTLLAATLCVGAPALAADPPVVQLTLKDHQFTPSEVHLPAGQATIVEVKNADATADEFEMRQLAIEKVIQGGGTGRVRLRPLAPGQYRFVGEYHEKTAHGVFIVDPAAK
jgi:hypothetical protein